MTVHFNRRRDLNKRRGLRREPTLAERRLWHQLRGSRLGFRFRRQFSIDAFVLDFYAPKLRLAIEVDGDSHFTDEAIAYDNQRTAFLNSFGIEVIRVTNLDVAANIDGGMDVILEAVRRRAGTKIT